MAGHCEERSDEAIFLSMPPLTFFWHDYETFGRVPRRDRPAQFAGVRTDADLNEIEAPLTLYCHPPRDSLPDPQSCLLTGILPQHCAHRGVPETQFAATIEAQLSRPGTVGVGYNSIGFDDEVTRFLFWRNLIEPYGREWQNDCGRWDLLDTVRCAFALRPEGIQWPKNGEGRHSFKLELLTQANGLAHDAAHDALSDVRATLALARLIKQRVPRLWDFCLRLRSKHAVKAELILGKPVLHVSGRYPVERGCLAVVWALAPHPFRPNEVIVWDLAQDPRVLTSLSAQEIRQRIFSRAADLPEGVTRLPIKTIHLNQSPVVISNLKTLSPAMAERWGVDWTVIDRHVLAAGSIMGDMAGVWEEVFKSATPEGFVDVDEDLYGGFLGDDDRRLLQRLRQLDPQALAREQPRFRDERLQELLFRYRARNFLETLSDEERAQWEAHRYARLLAPSSPGSLDPLSAYFEQLDALSEATDERGQEILSALYEWAQEIAPG